jgi:putative transcriptional regulator
VVAALPPACGRLLVATPDLEDPNFALAVVLLLEHDAEGTVGVVLNRPSQLRVAEALPTPPAGPGSSWEDLAAAPDVVFVGGPVQPNAVIALARVAEVTDPARWEPVLGDLGVIRLGEGPVPEVGEIRALRIFAGYAGWGAGQLDAELAEGSWFCVDAEVRDCTTAAPRKLWHAVLRRQGGVFASATDEPSLN